jgi:hypothetical protein
MLHAADLYDRYERTRNYIFSECKHVLYPKGTLLYNDKGKIKKLKLECVIDDFDSDETPSLNFSKFIWGGLQIGADKLVFDLSKQRYIIIEQEPSAKEHSTTIPVGKNMVNDIFDMLLGKPAKQRISPIEKMTRSSTESG